MVRAGTELATEQEARCITEARAEVLRQKVAEAEEARRMAEGTVAELRASLRLLETMREAAYSELRNTQQFIAGASSLFLLSLASGAGPSAPGHLELGFPLSHGVGRLAEITDECGKVLMLEETVEKVRVEHDRLWQEL